MSQHYIGKKVWIEQAVQGRVIGIREGFLVVQEDHRIRVDGTTETPIYEYERNFSGKTHEISLNIND